MIPRPDYVIVGSGAGGGTLAARLAERGATVVVLEAGGDPRQAPGMPEDYDVPAFHAQASENPATAWNFRVHHYADPARAARDPKSDARGVLYPRAGTLGGCTAHHAMIFMAPPPGDWDDIAALTGDASWSGANMRRYFERIESCNHRPIRRWLTRLGWQDPTRHGWGGWLGVQTAMPVEAFGDRAMLGTMLVSALAALGGAKTWRGWLARLFVGKGDPNDVRMGGAEGIWTIPLATTGHARQGTRERLREVAARHPDRLHIELDALATRVVLDAGGRAVGVEYLKGARLYGATPDASTEAGTRCRIDAAKEVILCGGAFNTPQLLMLSGIGPASELARLGIPLDVDLPGVGANLQDRYEVGVVFRMVRDWAAMRAARFRRGDPPFKRWSGRRRGMYISNGVAVGVSRRSGPATGPDADLWLMALLARFEGYATGYSKVIAETHDCLTWAILKGRTGNRSGTVRLHSTDARRPPRIDFNYFGEGGAADLAAVAEGVGIARDLAAASAGAGLIAEELTPGAHISGAMLDRWIEDHAWGHHACGTAAIGPRGSGGVLDADFRVHGVPRLRVVDASVFPRIPGFFISSAVMMVAEKAADAILAAPSSPGEPLRTESGEGWGGVSRPGVRVLR